MRPRVEVLFDACGARFHLREKLFELGGHNWIERAGFLDVVPYLRQRLAYLLQCCARTLRRLPAQLVFRDVTEDIRGFDPEMNGSAPKIARVFAELVTPAEETGGAHI